MPVKSRPASEYKTQYQPVKSFKSASFVPTAEQAVPGAGVNSVKLNIASEPPLQRKKRIPAPSSCINQTGSFTLEDDYALLGQQEKFANNVPYRPKKSHFLNPREGSPAKLQKIIEEEKIEDKSSKAPAPSVDTSKFTEPSTPLTPRKSKEESSSLIKQLKAEADQNLNNHATKPLKEKNTLQRQQIDVIGEPMDVNQNINNHAAEPTKHQKVDKMTEFAHRSNDKRNTIANKDASDNYVLKYKAKLTAPKPGRKLSEYQREFKWKKGVSASPLLEAEQVIYKSNEAVAPIIHDQLIKESEYKRQFKSWPQPVVKPKRDDGQTAKEQPEVQRSKSMSALNPENIPEAGSSSFSKDRRWLRESVPTPPPAPVPSAYGKLKRFATEYRANFKSPTRFSYDGAWKGADPPHLLPQKVDIATDENKSSPLSNWFAEVLELRRKAQEYKLRAQGTHFSREHLVQLLAQQNKYWDIQSSGSSTLSALSLEYGASSQLAEKKAKLPNSNTAEKDQNKEVSEEKFKPQKSSHDLENKTPVERKQAWSDEKFMQTNKIKGDVEEGNIDAKPLEKEADESFQGRIPTPEFKQKRVPIRRHHLDLTTPTVGGALLSSPPRPKTAPPEYSAESLSDSEVDHQLKHKTYNINRLVTSPTLGCPTKDTHDLRDDFAMEDQPLEPEYIQTRTNSPIRNSKRKVAEKPSMSTLNENYAMTYNKRIPEVIQAPVFHDDDNDSVLSLSVRSIASSCSAASQLFERAKQRRDNFWNDPGKSVSAK